MMALNQVDKRLCHERRQCRVENTQRGLWLDILQGRENNNNIQFYA